LRALGCRVAEAPGRLAACAELDGGRTLEIDCELDWPGPVDAPLGDEALIQAACGLMHVHGRRHGRPRALHVDYAATSAGVLAASGVLAAMIGAARGMPVATVRTSVAGAALLLVSQYLAAATADDEEWAESLLAGGPPFASADGVRFEIETLRAEPWVRFWTSLDADTAALRSGWPRFEQRFATATCALSDELHAATARKPFDELARLAEQACVSIMPLSDAAIGRAARADAGLADRPPWELTPLSAAQAAPAGVGGAVLPLDGLVVVEATRRLQGPLAGHVLALLGAHVVHIEPPGGDPLRGAPPMAGDTSARFLALNRLKERVEADITTPAGRTAVRELVSDADVFVHNWAPGKARELALDAPDLDAVRPGLVYAYASAWGPKLGSSPGLGTDFMVQALSGLGAALAPGEPPVASLMTLTDLLGGLVCAEGVLGALLARLRTGAGQRVDSSLLSAATVLLEPSRAPGRVTALHEPLAASDGHIALSSRAAGDPERAARVLGLEPEPDDAAAVVASVADRPARDTLERLRDGGVDAIDVCTDLTSLAADPRFAAALERRDCVFTRPPWTFSA